MYGMSRKKDVTLHGDRCEGRRTVVNATLNHSQLFLGLSRSRTLGGSVKWNEIKASGNLAASTSSSFMNGWCSERIPKWDSAFVWFERWILHLEFVENSCSTSLSEWWHRMCSENFPNMNKYFQEGKFAFPAVLNCTPVFCVHSNSNFIWIQRKILCTMKHWNKKNTPGCIRLDWITYTWPVSFHLSTPAWVDKSVI